MMNCESLPPIPASLLTPARSWGTASPSWRCGCSPSPRGASTTPAWCSAEESAASRPDQWELTDSSWQAVRQEQPRRSLWHRPVPAGVLAEAQAAADSPHQPLLGTHALHNILCLSLVSTFAATSACDWSTGTQWVSSANHRQRSQQVVIPSRHQTQTTNVVTSISSQP